MHFEAEQTGLELTAAEDLLGYKWRIHTSAVIKPEETVSVYKYT